ncbi:hypothetical protein BGZ73_004662 [Actinomortierella ambigua]|nr:hypothetical protein BGZ73_004662 [Actinomortierella ambigua]
MFLRPTLSARLVCTASASSPTWASAGLKAQHHSIRMVFQNRAAHPHHPLGLQSYRFLGAVSTPASRGAFPSQPVNASASASFQPSEQHLHHDSHSTAPTTHAKLIEWVRAQAALLEPDHIHWCTGTREENDAMVQDLVQKGVMIPLNDKLRPRSFLTRTDPADVARSESSTFICSQNKDDAG